MRATLTILLLPIYMLFPFAQVDDTVVYNCGELIYWMFNSDPIYYANHLFVNIYTFIQSDIVRAVLFSLILCERRRFGPTAR